MTEQELSVTIVEAFRNNDSARAVVQGMAQMSGNAVDPIDLASDPHYRGKVVDTWPNLDPKDGTVAHPPKGFPGQGTRLHIVDAMFDLLQRGAMADIAETEGHHPDNPYSGFTAIRGAGIVGGQVIRQVEDGAHE